jgi:hypothetical protein
MVANVQGENWLNFTNTCCAANVKGQHERKTRDEGEEEAIPAARALVAHERTSSDAEGRAKPLICETTHQSQPALLGCWVV